MITDALPDPPALAALHLAKTGRFTDMHGQDVTLSPDLLAQLAASYDPAIYQAPLVIGHPKTNSPAFGHLAKLELTPDGLFGEPINVDPAFAEAVNSGRYPQRSLSFWPADHPSSPTPGRPYIRHLGVLGAVPPAIPGLLGADLASDDVPTLTYSPPPAMSPPTMPDNTESIDLAARVAELATKEATLAATQAELERRAAELAEQEANARRAKVVAFCEGLAGEARIHPAAVPALAEILVKLEQDEDTAVCFAASDDPDTPQASATWLRRFLATLPPLVELATFADKNRAPAVQAPALNINAIYAARREAN